MLEKSEDNEEIADESVAVAAILESSELKEAERLDTSLEAALVTTDAAELTADATDDNRDVDVESVESVLVVVGRMAVPVPEYVVGSSVMDRDEASVASADESSEVAFVVVPPVPLRMVERPTT